MSRLSNTVLLSIIISIFCFSFSYGQHPNVMIGDYFDERQHYPNEPSIAINPINTNQILVTTNGPVGNYYYSTDAGASWDQPSGYSFSLGLWGDPCVVADTSGNFYFFHLERLRSPSGLGLPDRIFCRRLSGDNLGGNWFNVTFMGLNPPKMQDKEWATFDARNNNLYATWTQFDVYGSEDLDHFSNIMFSRSTYGGYSWSPAMRINEVPGDCLDGDNTVEGAVPATGPNGEVYVTWAGPVGIVFDKSTDEGDTWLEHDIFVSDNPGGWAFPNMPGIYRCGGQPVISCDVSNGAYRGNIYIIWSDERNGVNDHDIWLSKSTDGGETWGEPKRVNDDPPGKHQFFYWMTIDQTNGYIYIFFNDRRNYDDTRTDVYLAVSKNGGETFLNYKISESPYVPSKGVFFGDYTNIAAHNNVIRPVWPRMDNGRVSMWTALVNPALLWTDGDVDFNGTVDVTDLISVINFILALTIPSEAQFAVTDMNKDGIINVLDLIAIINIILKIG